VQGLAIRVGIFVLIGIGALILRPFMAGSAGDLKVGECFDVPTAAESIEDVQHHPCTDSHTGEVFFVGEFPIAAQGAYPGDEALAPMVDTLCTPAFAAYTGLLIDTDPVWTYGAGVPIAKDWADGKRRLMCYAHRMDDQPTTASIKKS
jgi:putative regulator of septum formation